MTIFHLKNLFLQYIKIYDVRYMNLKQLMFLIKADMRL